MNPMYTGDPTQTLQREQNVSVVVRVLTDDKQRLDRQAVVKLYSEAHQTTTWQTTTGRSEADFIDMSVGKYDIEVSAVGYFTGHAIADVKDLVNTVTAEVIMQRDPSAVDLDAADTLMSPQATKELKHAVKALKAGNLKEGQKRLEATEKLAPSSAQVKFLFGYLFFQKKDFEQAQAYLAQAAVLNPHHSQALTLLGRVQLLRGQYAQASKSLEQAVDADPDNWMAHNLLADAYLEQHEYEKTREQAQLAIDKGRRDGAGAQLVLGEALANLGKIPEGIAALRAFLEAEPKNSSVAQAQALLKQLELRQTNATAGSGTKGFEATASETVTFTIVHDMDLAATSKLPDTAWQPPGIDRGTPPVATGVSCPYEKVVDGAGKRVEQFVDDVAKFAAIEDMLHERLDEMGNPTTKETRKFDYAASISQARPGVVLVDEYRTERYGMENLPDQFADKGFAALALVFHPAMRDGFRMTCEGLGDWHGQATWLIHFRQREDRPNRIQSYLVGAANYPVDLKGRAWITADKFQIVRIESEMVSPLPEIQLLAEHQITEYGPVPFPKKNTELWLPKSAEVYMHFRGHRYYRKHSFAKYMLFSVEETQKDREAKHDPSGPGSTSPRKRKWWQS
jgi:tetratricopeptide (TPR) repeat protein